MGVISERFRKQVERKGKRYGILFRIETALEMRFGLSSISLMDRISTIDDPEELNLLLRQIELDASLEAVQKILVYLLPPV